MNLAANRAYNPLFADETLLHGLKRLAFETQYSPWGGGGVPHCSYSPAYVTHCKMNRTSLMYNIRICVPYFLLLNDL